MDKDDKSVQRVKIVGPLNMFKSVFAIIRDILLILFLIVGIAGIVSIVGFVSQLPANLGEIMPLGLLEGQGVAPQMMENGIDSSLQSIKQFYREGKITEALQEVQRLDDLARSMGIPAAEREILTVLRQAIEERDSDLFYQTLEEIKKER